MQIYKRAFITLLMGVIGAPFSGVVVFVVGSFFIESTALLTAIAVIVCVVILWLTVFNENIYFTLSESGQFSYYKRGKLRQQLDIPHCYVGYYRKTTDATDHDIQLRILPVGSDEMDTIYIDASPLGASRFEKMFAELEKFAANEPEVMTAVKK